MDANSELTDFERDLLLSVRQAQSGEFAVVHTAEQIVARKRGRPVGAVAVKRKVSTTIRLDEDVMGAFKACGAGWQSRINAVLREAVQSGQLGAPLA